MSREESLPPRPPGVVAALDELEFVREALLEPATELLAAERRRRVLTGLEGAEIKEPSDILF